ncbi:RNA-binding domain-containing protein [Levilactobacillus brevis]|uniref:RNA-binding domain-containing protein n=1 Tax=Levilactobacillus brevis TaxID=1580 RepID=UPI0035A32FBE
MEALEFTSIEFTRPSEGITREYKTASFKLPDNFWDTYSAFANTDGGTIILGIEEAHKHHYEVCGVDVPDDVITQFWNDLHNSKKISSSLTSTDDVLKYKIFGKTIIQIYVPKAANNQRPVYINNVKTQAYLRTDDGDRIVNDEEFKYLIVDSQSSIDDELLENYTLDDLNLDDVHKYRDMLLSKTQEPETVKSDDMEFLQDIGVFKIDRAQYARPLRMTTGGLLFFGKLNAITSRFPHFQLDYFRYAGDNDTDWIDRVSSGDMNFPSLNIFSFYNLVIDKLPLGIQDPFNQESNMTRGSYFADLKKATKEALVNTLMHPYYDSSATIKIVDKKSYFEFYNPGDMRVSIDSFIRGQDPRSRNSVIASLFRKVGIAERAGSGGPRIFASAEKNHLHAPDVLTNPDSTQVRIWKIDLLSSLNEKYQLTQNEMLILKIIADNGYISTKILKEKLESRLPDITLYKVRKYLQNLQDNEIIYSSGKGPATRYGINTSEEQSVLEATRIFKHLEDNTFWRHH